MLDPAQRQLGFALWKGGAVMLGVEQGFGAHLPMRCPVPGDFPPQQLVNVPPKLDLIRLKAWLEDEGPRRDTHAKMRISRYIWATRPPFARTRSGFAATRL